MDPGLFRIDFGVLTEAIIAVIVLAFFVERALSLVFEHRVYINHLDKKGFKEPIAFGLSLVVCVGWRFDVIAVVLYGDAPTIAGYAITAAIIAGGSKGSIKLFHDLMNVRSTAAKELAVATNGGKK
jgi:hypothetical protein